MFEVCCCISTIALVSTVVLTGTKLNKSYTKTISHHSDGNEEAKTCIVSGWFCTPRARIVNVRSFHSLPL